MTLARRFAALVLIVVSLLLPGGSGSAWAMADHAGQADCPHAAMVLPSGNASHGGAMAHVAMAHVMPVVAVSGAPHPLPAAAPSLPACCIAITSTVPALDAGPAFAAGETGARLRPLSDAMPAQRSIGPDLPPPRA
ncbi:MAG: hypothetical protein J0H20_14675 [Rhizobiales bacterium]|nr:hypothetical protein [Hyphomicrobiales bacterium]